MSKEKRPKNLLPLGWQEFEITACTDEFLSSNNNPQYKLDFSHKESGKTIEIYAVNIPKKRWLLKNIMEACGVPKDSEGNFNWPDNVPLKEYLIGKRIMADVEHQERDWTAPDGNVLKLTDNKIVEVKSIEWKE